MRLIDADKLIKTIEGNDYMLCDEIGSADRGMFTIGIMQAIDEQPHVDFDEINNKRTEFCDYVYDLLSDEPTNNKANAVICLYDELISEFERVGEGQQ